MELSQVPLPSHCLLVGQCPYRKFRLSIGLVPASEFLVEVLGGEARAVHFSLQREDVLLELAVLLAQLLHLRLDTRLRQVIRLPLLDLPLLQCTQQRKVRDGMPEAISTPPAMHRGVQLSTTEMTCQGGKVPHNSSLQRWQALSPSCNAQRYS